MSETTMHDPADLSSLIPLHDVPARLPRSTTGRRLHRSAIYRWVQHGIRGIRLRCLVVGGRKYTSEAWLLEFIDATTKARMPVREMTRDERAAANQRHLLAVSRLKARGLMQ